MSKPPKRPYISTGNKPTKGNDTADGAFPEEPRSPNNEVTSGARASVPLRVLAMGLSFLTTAALARELGPSNWGSFAVLLATANISYLVVGLQIQSQAARAHSVLEADRFLAPGMVAGFAAAGVVLVAGTMLAETTSERASVWLIAAGIPFRAILSAFTGATIARRVPGNAALTLVSLPFSRSLVTVSVLSLTSTVGLPTAAGIESMAVLIATVLVGFRLRRLGYRPQFAERAPLSAVAKAGLQIAVAAVGWFLIERTSTFVLDAFAGPEEVGRFRVAIRLGELPLELFLAGLALFLPSIARGDLGERRSAIKAAFYPSVTFFGPLCLSLAFFGREMVVAVFGDAFQLAGSVYLMVGLAVYIHVVAGPNSAYLIAVGRLRVLALITIACAVGDGVMQMLLVPTYGVLGSAVMFLASISLLNVTCTFLMIKDLVAVASERWVVFREPILLVLGQLVSGVIVAVILRGIGLGGLKLAIVGTSVLAITSFGLAMVQSGCRDIVFQTLRRER